ncbi:MAG: 5'-3' exonuclease H3TH domain-containing protein, partial [Pseudomonadota bacterium]|nr:5'-3' exonuclease H3TH domain-containing protein [Pseudomonadota bacterium]
MAEAGRDHLYLVDGSGFIFRAFHALPPMSRADGTPTNAVFGFTNMLMKLIEDMAGNHLAVVFDTARTTFRSEIYPEYKAHRPPPPDELVPQFALVREAVAAFNVASVEMAGFEADDLIATYTRQARAAGQQVTIVSSDKDLMQLVGDGVEMLDPMKNRRIGPSEVVEKFGVGPERVVDVQALAGDSTDNVPGVPGIGVKTAAQLIGDYGDLDSLLAKATEIKQPKRRQTLIDHAEMARVSRELVRLRDDVEVPLALHELVVQPPSDDTLLAFFKAQSFKRLIARLEGQMAQGVGDPNGGEGAELAPDETAYELVQEMADLERWIDEARDLGVVAVDTET